MPIKRIELNATPQITPLSSIKPYLTSNSPTNQKQKKEVNRTEIWSTKCESNVQILKDRSMPKNKEGLCFEQDINKCNDEVITDNGNQKNIDIDSESDNEDVQQPACSSDFEISQQQDMANVMGGMHDSTTEREIVIETKKENNGDETETQDIDEVVINVFNIPNTHTNNAFLSLESPEELAQVENRNAVVTMSEETQSTATKNINTKRCIFICVVISIAMLCLILAIVLGIKLT